MLSEYRIIHTNNQFQRWKHTKLHANVSFTLISGESLGVAIQFGITKIEKIEKCSKILGIN